LVAFGDGGGSGPVAAPKKVDPTLGVLIFVASEVMLFAGLISSLLVTRASAPFWPPLDQPRLPVAQTGFNTVLFIASAFTMLQAVQAIRAHQRAAAVRWMMVTSALGVCFLALQGVEWVRLLGFGLTMTSSLYGALFYLIIGVHGVHLIGALVVMGVMTFRVWRGRYDKDPRGVVACALYWCFVVILWPILYALVYLA
jgi:heme/copper-type cytochrome/quinol oxidase subunit 3